MNFLFSFCYLQNEKRSNQKKKIWNEKVYLIYSGSLDVPVLKCQLNIYSSFMHIVIASHLITFSLGNFWLHSWRQKQPKFTEKNETLRKWYMVPKTICWWWSNIKLKMENICKLLITIYLQQHLSLNHLPLKSHPFSQCLFLFRLNNSQFCFCNLTLSTLRPLNEDILSINANWFCAAYKYLVNFQEHFGINAFKVLIIVNKL